MYKEILERFFDYDPNYDGSLMAHEKAFMRATHALGGGALGYLLAKKIENLGQQ